MFGFEKEELKTLRKLDSPKKIQNFLESLKINFEESGDTCMSPRKVLRERRCHCIEGAMLACSALMINKQPPLVVDLTATKEDFDHVITVFKEDNKWGAISKTNHAVLRYREPVYNSIRELVMSFFYEYTDDFGRKTLRSFTLPVNLSKFNHLNWTISEEDVWEIPAHLAEIRHFPILNKSQIMKLRKADEIEIQAGKLLEWNKV